MAKEINEKWVLSAYGSKAGRMLLEELNQAQTAEARARAIARAAVKDQRVDSLNGDADRVMTPFLSRAQEPDSES